MAAKKGPDKLLLFLAMFVVSTIFLCVAQMSVYLKADTTNALHFVTGEHGVPGLVWNGTHHVQTKGRSAEHAPRALRGRSQSAAHGIAVGEECHLGGPFWGFIPGCSKDCEQFRSHDQAFAACLKEPSCGGVTSNQQETGEAFFQLRAHGETESAKDGREFSYRKFCAKTSIPPPVVKTPPPAEWELPPGYEQNYETLGTKVNGEPTIFISIASYRDDLCHNTIKEALKMADLPERLFFGAVEQSVPSQGDLPCNFTMVPCDVDPSQLLCVHAHQITVDRVDARAAQGPTYGRYRADRLYRGEYFSLQIDAHMYFVKHWDTRIIAQWKATKNEYAVLTTYPSDMLPGSMDGSGHSTHMLTPVLCKSNFVADGMIKHQAAGEIAPRKPAPILHPLWAAGSSFSRGHRMARVPYDLYPMMFDGEEFAMAVRMWTSGYDFYTFQRVLVFHPYMRKTRPKSFWENSLHYDEKEGALERYRTMLTLRAPPAGYDKKAAQDIAPGGKYGLGLTRKLSTFLSLFGYDLRNRRSRDNCQWAYSQELHADLTEHLRDDRKGIDYTQVPIDELLKKHGLSEVPDQQLVW